MRTPVLRKEALLGECKDLGVCQGLELRESQDCLQRALWSPSAHLPPKKLIVSDSGNSTLAS